MCPNDYTGMCLYQFPNMFHLYSHFDNKPITINPVHVLRTVKDVAQPILLVMPFVSFRICL